MTANDPGSIVKDLFGIADCELTGTEETIDKGKRVKNIRLAYCGPVPEACGVCGGKTYSHGKRMLKVADTMLKYFETEQYFYFVAGSTLDGSRSKKGDVIRYALDSLKITADQAVMVGDRKHDVIGAKENGMYVIGVLYGYGDRMELETAGADCIVADVNELKVKLNNI